MILLWFWLFFAVLNAGVASSKNRNPFLWFVIGLVFGIFSLLVVLIAEKKQDKTLTTCPRCKEDIKKDALICKHCGVEFVA